MRSEMLTAALLGLATLATEARAATIGVNPRRTYLRTNNDGGALAAVPIDLATLGLTSGDRITVTRLGDFNCTSTCVATGMIAVFSSSGTLLASSQPHRVPGAIDAGEDVITGPTFFGGFATDIPQDWAVAGTGVTHVIPAGATHLFVSAPDTFYGDNGDFNGDYAVKIEELVPPTANAGADQSIHAGQVVTLDGAGSFDDNTATEDLLFAWTLTGTPAGSSAALAGADTASPSFVADLAGEYVVSLTVTDADGLSSAADIVLVGSLNAAPVANAGSDQGTFVGETLTLDGSSSADPDGDGLEFWWTLATPAGSTAALAGETTAFPTFTPDLPGTYTATLTVNDPFGGVGTDSVDAAVVTAESFAESLVMQALNRIGALEPWQVTTRGNQGALQSFLTQAIAGIQAGDVDEALGRVGHAIERVDGCVLRGSPDGNGPGRDWVTDCVAQAPLYEDLTAAMAALTP